VVSSVKKIEETKQGPPKCVWQGAFMKYQLLL